MKTNSLTGESKAVSEEKTNSIRKELVQGSVVLNKDIFVLFSGHVRLCDSMDCSPPGSYVHGMSRQEYWSGLPFPYAGDLPDPGVKPAHPTTAGGFFTTEPPGTPKLTCTEM